MGETALCAALHLATLVPLLFISGVTADISPECLKCLSKVLPVDGCITANAVRNCGPFSITENFYKDCSSTDNRLDPADFEECAKDYACGARCAESQHNKLSSHCLNSIRVRRRNYTRLTCADYGRMHFGGIHACTVDDSPLIATYLQNMTTSCGCQGTCAGGNQSAAGPSAQQLAMYVAPPVALVILVVVVALLIITLKKCQKRKSESAEKVVTQPSESDGIYRSTDLQTSPPPYGSAAPGLRNRPGLPTPASDTVMSLTTTGTISGAEKHSRGSAEIYHQAAPARITVADGDAASLGEPADKHLYLNSNDLPRVFDDMYVNMAEERGADPMGKSLRSKAPVPAPRSSIPGGAPVGDVDYVNRPVVGGR